VPKFAIYLSAAIGLFFSAAGVLLTCSQVLRGRKPTEAEILSATVESYQASGDGQTYTAYRTKYEVRYLAEGRFFERPLRGNQVSRMAEEARHKSRHNTAGARRTVYYLPGRPEDFLPDPLGFRAGLSLLTLSIGLAILAGTVLMWYQAKPLDW
jgi:hypothetical protein